jgi:hypothetical protein
VDVGHLAAAGVGLVIGLGLGAAYVLRLLRARRAAFGAAAGLARFLSPVTPTRSAADILAGRIRVLLGGVIYELPVLSRAASRTWRETLDLRFIALSADLERAGDNAAEVLARLLAETDAMLDMLYAYDQTGVLPSRDLLEGTASDPEILHAVIEVWRAANPLAATLAETIEPPTSGTSSEPPSGLPRPMDGAQTSSSTA